MRSRDRLKNLYFHFHKDYSYYIWEGADFRDEIQQANVLSRQRRVVSHNILRTLNEQFQKKYVHEGGSWLF